MEKLLTVSVAAYNGAATLQKALESCLVADESLQALLDVIIIDDGSTDGTAALAQAFVQAHPGSFRLVSKVNGGYGSTLNTAVELASGRYFRTLDCDDWFDTNALQTLLRRLQNCTADAVYTNYRTVQENGTITFTSNAGYPAQWQMSEDGGKTFVDMPPPPSPRSRLKIRHLEMRPAGSRPKTRSCGTSWSR